MEEEIVEDVEELDTVIAELEISKGKGNLILCVVNSPLYRNRIIQTLRGRFASKVIDVKDGDQIIDILKGKNFDGADVLMWVMPEEPTKDMLNTLNNFRELFYEGEIPNVIFYNLAFSESVITKAPDFWRYRGNYYEFKEAERGLSFEALEALTTPLTFKDKEDLQRRKRINEYLLEKVRDKVEKSNILSELGIIVYYLGELDKALEYYTKALKLDEEIGRKEGVANQLGNIGSLYSKQGELDKALEYHKKALELNEKLGREEGIASQLGNIGIIYGETGELDKALEYFEKALELNEKLERKEGIANQLGNIGIIYSIQGELNKALEYHQKALKLDEELEKKVGIASQLGNIGVVLRRKGELDNALEYFEKALELDEKLGRKVGVAIQLKNIGSVYYTKKELDKALEYNKKALEIYREIDNKIKTTQILTTIGDIFILKGDKKRAMDYYSKAQNLATGSPIFEDITKRLKAIRDEENVKGIKQKTQVRAAL